MEFRFFPNPSFLKILDPRQGIVGTILFSILIQVKNLIQLNEREIIFLKLVCTELTYKEIAEKMFLSPRTIDGYRDDLFQKLNAKTRVGLVMYAIKNGIVNI